MPHQVPVILLLMTSSLSLVQTNNGSWDKCGGRLERALDTIRRESSRRNRLDDEDLRMVYQQKLKSAPLEMTVSRVIIKVPQDTGIHSSGPWAKVERCIYEPSNNSIQTRVIFNDLSVSGLVSLLPREYNVDIPGESCRMSLRLRKAGVEFYTNPIARGRSQMRIRTEYSFLEPRFVSMYAYGCHPTRLDKQIKRQDKWPPYQKPNDESLIPQPPLDEQYEAAEPRELSSVSSDEDVIIANENRVPRTLYAPGARLGIWRNNDWITKSRKRRAFPNISVNETTRTQTQKDTNFSVILIPKNKKNSEFTVEPESTFKFNRNQRFDSDDKVPLEVITPNDFVLALARQAKPYVNSVNLTSLEHNLNTKNQSLNLRTDLLMNSSTIKEITEDSQKQIPRETREIFLEDDHLDENPESLGRDWQSREYVAREMEDIFLRGASQALTRYIEKQLQPAMKETLMLSMGYTISYG